MQWLTALLAFAVTMLIFAIIVSTFVELIHRLFGYRSQGLRLMLESLYERVIKDRLTRQDKPTAQEFAQIIMENRALAAQPEPTGLIRRFLHWLVDSSVVTDIPVEVFTQKLADNRIISIADDWSDNIIKDIAQKYEAFGNEASAYFQKRARVFSVLIAFLVAWAFYIHPYNLAVTYVKNPELAQTVAEKAEETHAEYRALAARLEETMQDGAASATETDALKVAMNEFSEKIDESAAKTRELSDIGVPVGWPEGMVFYKPGFGNAFWLLVGGLLVGLGAPFWAQAVASLTATRDVTRKITEIVNPGSVVTTGAFGTKSIGLAPGAPPTSVASFVVAQRAAGQAELNRAPKPVTPGSTTGRVKEP
jgi:hypothetical protein